MFFRYQLNVWPFSDELFDLVFYAGYLDLTVPICCLSEKSNGYENQLNWSKLNPHSNYFQGKK
jgi:hypothetical protein